MSSYERPGVYSSYEVTSALYGSGGGRGVGVAAVASAGTKGEVTLITGAAQAANLYGPGSNLTQLIRTLLENGAPRVYAVPAVTAGSAAQGDYEAAFAALMEEPDIGCMVCDSQSAAVHKALREAVLSGTEQTKYRVAVVEQSGTASALCAAALALNCERVALVGNAIGDGVPGIVAAAVAGVVAGSTDPALPFNGAVLKGLGTLSAALTDAELAALIQGGVTPVERVGGDVTIVRAVTTRTKTGDVPDKTWRDLNTVLIVDDVLPTVRNSLRARFARTKNTAQTRGAVRTQVIIELEAKRQAEIIESYGAVTAAASEEDPTVCLVSFAFTVAHGLSRIQLMAHITV